MPKPIKESDLAVNFVQYLEKKGYEVFSEVPAGQIVDIVGTKDGLNTSVEVKTSMNFKVIEQARYNQHKFHYSYVAVPAKKIDFSLQICRDYGIGVLFFYPKGGVIEMVAPKLNEPKKAVKLEQYMKMSKAGSQNERMTAYGFSILSITELLKKEDGQSLVEILKTVKHHWKNDAVARTCITKYCSNGIIKEFKLIKGKLYLSN